MRNGRIVSVRPALDAPVNKGHLCVKGRYAFGFVHADDRITVPMIRERGSWRPCSWADARAFVSGRLGGLIHRDGADSIGLLGSAVLGRHRARRHPKVDYRTGVHEVTVRGHGPVPYQVDGDHLGDAHVLVLRYEPDILDLVIP